MRMIVAVALVVTASGALADEIGDAHRLALQGRDSYWNCLAREYSREGTQEMSAADFTADIASVCPSEAEFPGDADRLSLDAISRCGFR